MTPEQFSKLLGQQQEELKRAFARTLPVKIGNEAVNFARDNFRKEGFMDGSLKPWAPSKRKSDPKHPDRAYATLSSRRMHLYKSIQKRTQPGVAIIYSSVPYAAAHNEGTRNAGRSHRVVLLKRQFIGPSKTLDEKARKIIDTELKRILNIH